MELNEKQSAAVNCLDHNLQIVACAGSGKTEVITRRIVNILHKKTDVMPENIVAFTFTEKAAENMRLRVERSISDTELIIDTSKMFVGTIHSFCQTLLNDYVAEFKGFTILDEVKEHLFIMKYFKKSGAGCLGLKKCEFKLFAECIDKMVDAYEEIEKWPKQVKEVFEQYKNLLYEHRFINFSLLILEVLLHLNEPKVFDRISRIKYLIVDEYQDIDDLQERLIKEISKFGSNVCVVGDDDQTIYQFRGSNAQNMIDFHKRYDDVVTINLDTNYRSGKAILDVADAVISNNDNRLVKKMKSGNELLMGTVDGSCRSDIDAEYHDLSNDIKNLSQTVDYGNMAILLRKRSRLTELVRVLISENIPYHAEESDEFFESIYYPKFCNVFKYLEKPNDEIRQLLIDDWKNLTKAKNLKMAIRYLSRCCEKNEGFVILFNQFIEEMGFDEEHKVKKYAKGFSRILHDFDQVYTEDSWTIRISDINMFIKLDVESEYQKASLLESNAENVVQIMTVHHSKGLEFDAVFIPDMQQGFFPSNKIGGKKYYSVLGGVFEDRKNKYESNLEDERKLFYVAITRAKKHLRVYADVEKRGASQFLTEMNQSPYCDIQI